MGGGSVRSRDGGYWLVLQLGLVWLKVLLLSFPPPLGRWKITRSLEALHVSSCRVATTSNRVASLMLWHAQKDPVRNFGSKLVPFLVFVMSYLYILHEAPKGMDLLKVYFLSRPGNQWYATFESRCWCFDS